MSQPDDREATDLLDDDDDDDYNVMLKLVERVRTRVILGRGGMFTKERDPIMSNNMSMIGATFHTYTAERREAMYRVFHLRRSRDFLLTLTCINELLAHDNVKSFCPS